MHVNFYENLEEMHRRLLGSVVTYDGEPGSILAITNHKSDGIFRIYFLPLSIKFKDMDNFPRYQDFRNGSAEQGAYLDKWMEANPKSGLMRKHANSPSFNKFRPFPLGMMNMNGRAHYLERSPDRKTYQGLVPTMVMQTPVTMESQERIQRRWSGNITGPEFNDCVKGLHPTARECMENLLDPSNENSAVAFHRNFAFIRGPLDTFYLQYKTDVVGFVPASKRPQVELGKKFTYIKEAVEETGQFEEIRVRG